MDRTGIFAAMLMCLLTQAVFAETTLWQGDVSSEWDTSTLNWTRDGVPSRAYQDGDDAIFDNSATTFSVTSTDTSAPGSVLVSNTTPYAISAAIGGAGALTKSGSGTLTLSGTNTYSGGTVVDGGTLRVQNDDNLGDAAGGVTFSGTGTLRMDVAGKSYYRDLTLSDGVVATFDSSRNNFFYASNAITGSGGVTLKRGTGWAYLTLSSTGNTFTGPITAQGGDRAWVIVNSLTDGPGAGAITLSGNQGRFIYDTGAVVPLVLDYRPIVVGTGGGQIENRSSYTTTFNGGLSCSGTGAKTLTLLGNSGGTLAGDIGQGESTLKLTKGSGTWSLAGSNTYSGVTTLESGTLAILGSSAMATNTKVLAKRSTTLSIRTDEAGSVNLGNEFEVAPIDTSTGVLSQHSIDVRNNGGATTGSTIALGTVNLATGDMRANRQINVRGGNGYILQVGDVRMSPNLRGTATGGPNRFNPTSASLIISGTVKQVDGDTGSSTTDNTLYLGGTMAGNLVSGTIADADDYTSGSNVNANALHVYKGDSSEWTLSGTSTYTGTTIINGGTLQVSGSISSTNVTVGSGALGGTGTVAGSVTLSGTGGIDLRDGGVGTLTVGTDLNINGATGASDLSFDLGTGANGTDQITVAGDVTVLTSGACVVTLNQISGTKIAAGPYDLIVATGTMPAATNFTLATTAAFGNTFSLQRDGTAKKLQLVVTSAAAAPALAFWDGSGANDSWSTLANWATDVSGSIPLSAAPGYETDVSFYATGASRLTTGALDADFDINSLTYVASATANTTIGGSTKTVILEAGSGQGITVDTPTTNSPLHTIDANVAVASSQTWTVESGAALTVAGVVGDFGAGRSITKDGTGTLRLSGLNTYRGATTLEAGTLEIWHWSVGNAIVPSPLGMSSADPSNLVLHPGTTLEFVTSSDGARFMDRGFTINGTAPGDGVALIAGGSGNKGVSLTYSGSPAYGTPDQTRTLTLAGTIATGGGNYNQGYELAARIADNGAGAVSLIKSGSGAWQLLGTSSYSGGTTISGGSLRLAVANALPSAGVVTIADVSGAQLTLDNYNQTIGSLSGGGTNGGNVTLGSGTLTVGDASSTTYAGKISGSGGLTKQGSGTLTLTGTNTYSGTTTVNAGTLQLAGEAALGTGDVILDGGTLGMAGFSGQVGTLTLAGSSTVALGSGSLSFADSSGAAWSGMLSLTGSLGRRTLRFGSDVNALTEEQLDRIVHGGAAVHLSEDGYLRSRRGSVLFIR